MEIIPLSFIPYVSIFFHSEICLKLEFQVGRYLKKSKKLGKTGKIIRRYFFQKLGNVQKLQQQKLLILKFNF